MADEITDLLSEIGSLASRDKSPLSWDQIATYDQSDAPLSPIEKILGYSRSYLSGPTFNYGDNLEASIASMFTGRPQEQELSNIRGQQKRFKDKTEYLDNATELVSAALLNPFQKLKEAKAVTTAISDLPILPTLRTIFTSAPAQAAIASAGAADGKDVLENALAGAVIGGATSAAADIAGNVLQKTARNADRMKLSAFGIGAADLRKSLKSVGDEADLLGSASNIPIVKTLQAAENSGIINVGEDALTNARSIRGAQNGIAANLTGLLKEADDEIAPRVDFSLENTINYIESLSGTAKEKATAAADAEINALIPQLKRGTLADLQRVKIGLNYKYDENPYGSDIVKALRSDLRQEIENRVNDAAQKKLISPKLTDAVRKLNSMWGNLAELKDAFVSRGYRDIQGNPIEDLVRGQATTGGTGTLNLASAQTGNPLFTAIGAILTTLRSQEGLSHTADVLRDPAIGGIVKMFGKALPEIVTARNVAQARSALTVPKEESDIGDLLSEIEALGGGKKKMSDASISEIKADPYYNALAHAESGFNATAKNPDSSAKGLFQLIDSTSKSLGVEDPFDVDQAFKGVKKLTQDHVEMFGNDPATLYSAHYLGARVLKKVLNKEDLSPTEKAQVAYLKEKALPRFMRFYADSRSA